MYNIGGVSDRWWHDSLSMYYIDKDVYKKFVLKKIEIYFNFSDIFKGFKKMFFFKVSVCLWPLIGTLFASLTRN